MADISNEKVAYSATLILDGINQSGFADDVVRLYSEIVRDFSRQLLEKPRREFEEIDYKRIRFEGISLLTALYFFNELPKVIKKRKFLFLRISDSESLCQIRKQILYLLKRELDSQGYSVIRDINVNEFDRKTGEISFGASSSLDISTRVELYAKLGTMNEVSKKFTMKLAYAIDPENIAILQILGPIFVGPFQKIAELILKKVYETSM